MPYISVLEKERPKVGELLKSHKINISKSIASILILNTIANTLGAAAVGAQAEHVFGSSAVFWVSVVLTFIIFILVIRRSSLNKKKNKLGFQSIKEMKELIKQGFSSKQDYQLFANSGATNINKWLELKHAGFLTVNEQQKAKSLGFDTFEEQKKATDLGFTTKDEMNKALSLGFADKKEWEQAKKLGFETKSQWLKAKSLGFSSKREWEQAISQGFKDAKTKSLIEKLGFQDFLSFKQSTTSDITKIKSTIRELREKIISLDNVNEYEISEVEKANNLLNQIQDILKNTKSRIEKIPVEIYQEISINNTQEIIQEINELQEETERKKITLNFKYNRLMKLAKIINSYTRISLEKLASFLSFSNTEQLEEWLLGLNSKHILIDGNDVLIQREQLLNKGNSDVEQAISELLRQFEEFEKEGKGKI